MSDLSVAERIAAEALAGVEDHFGDEIPYELRRNGARAVVAALAAAGWLVEPVDRPEPTSLNGGWWADSLPSPTAGSDLNPVSPTPPAPAPPASSP